MRPPAARAHLAAQEPQLLRVVRPRSRREDDDAGRPRREGVIAARGAQHLRRGGAGDVVITPRRPVRDAQPPDAAFGPPEVPARGDAVGLREVVAGGDDRGERAPAVLGADAPGHRRLRRGGVTPVSLHREPHDTRGVAGPGGTGHPGGDHGGGDRRQDQGAADPPPSASARASSARRRSRSRAASRASRDPHGRRRCGACRGGRPMPRGGGAGGRRVAAARRRRRRSRHAATAAPAPTEVATDTTTRFQLAIAPPVSCSPATHGTPPVRTPRGDSTRDPALVYSRACRGPVVPERSRAATSGGPGSPLTRS